MANSSSTSSRIIIVVSLIFSYLCEMVCSSTSLCGALLMSPFLIFRLKNIKLKKKIDYIANIKNQIHIKLARNT